MSDCGTAFCGRKSTHRANALVQENSDTYWVTFHCMCLRTSRYITARITWGVKDSTDTGVCTRVSRTGTTRLLSLRAGAGAIS